MTATMSMELVAMFHKVTGIKLNSDNFCWSPKAEISRRHIEIETKLVSLQFGYCKESNVEKLA